MLFSILQIAELEILNPPYGVNMNVNVFGVIYW